MNIYEYQAKKLFQDANIKILKGCLFNDKIEDFSDQYVIKAQIHSGGRGKAGGIKIAKSFADMKKISYDMIGTTLFTKQSKAGEVVSKIYIEECLEFEKEYYLSIVLNSSKHSITIITSQYGGVDIEELARDKPNEILTIETFNTIQMLDIEKILSFLEITQTKKRNSFADLIVKLYNLFIKTDAIQIEINPLVFNKESECVALDAKITIDDNSLFRQQEILDMRDISTINHQENEAFQNDLSFIKMNGNIGCLVNGAGLAMATMDMIKFYGAEAANFLDIGGGATEERIEKALEIILEDRNVNIVLINIFGGIIQCDMVARSIVNIMDKNNINTKIIARLNGTNHEIAKEIITNANLNIITEDDLTKAVKLAIEESAKQH